MYLFIYVIWIHGVFHCDSVAVGALLLCGFRVHADAAMASRLWTTALLLLLESVQSCPLLIKMLFCFVSYRYPQLRPTRAATNRHGQRAEDVRESPGRAARRRLARRRWHVLAKSRADGDTSRDILNLTHGVIAGISSGSESRKETNLALGDPEAHSLFPCTRGEDFASAAPSSTTRDSSGVLSVEEVKAACVLTVLHGTKEYLKDADQWLRLGSCHDLEELCGAFAREACSIPVEAPTAMQEIIPEGLCMSSSEGAVFGSGEGVIDDVKSYPHRTGDALITEAGDLQLMPEPNFDEAGCEEILCDEDPSGLQEGAGEFGEVVCQAGGRGLRYRASSDFSSEVCSWRGGGGCKRRGTSPGCMVADSEDEALEAEVPAMEAAVVAQSLSPPLLLPAAQSLSVYDLRGSDLAKGGVEVTRSRGLLQLDQEAEEPPAQLLALLSGASGPYLSLQTSGDGACGLHAAFGRPVCRELKCSSGVRTAVAAKFEAYVAQTQSGARQGSAHFAKVWSTLWCEFCLPCAKQEIAASSSRARSGFPSDFSEPETEAKCFWENMALDSRRQLCQHLNEQENARRIQDEGRAEFATVARRCCDLEIKQSLFRPFASLCELLPDVTTNFLEMTEAERLTCIATSPSCSEFLEEPFRVMQDGRMVVKGTRDVPFPSASDNPPRHKYAAVFDSRPCFDAIRSSLLRPTQHGARARSQAMFEIVDQLRDCPNIVRQKGEELAARLMEEDDNSPVEPINFVQLAWPAYFKALQDRRYYFSCEELLWLAECTDANVVVAKSQAGRFLVEGYELGHAGVSAVIYLQAGAQGRVRSHFERLCTESAVSEARANPAAEAAVAAHLDAEKAAAEEANRLASAERRRLHHAAAMSATEPATCKVTHADDNVRADESLPQMNPAILCDAKYNQNCTHGGPTASEIQHLLPTLQEFQTTVRENQRKLHDLPSLARLLASRQFTALISNLMARVLISEAVACFYRAEGIAHHWFCSAMLIIGAVNGAPIVREPGNIPRAVLDIVAESTQDFALALWRCTPCSCLGTPSSTAGYCSSCYRCASAEEDGAHSGCCAKCGSALNVLCQGHSVMSAAVAGRLIAEDTDAEKASKEKLAPAPKRPRLHNAVSESAANATACRVGQTGDAPKGKSLQETSLTLAKLAACRRGDDTEHGDSAAKGAVSPSGDDRDYGAAVAQENSASSSDPESGDVSSQSSEGPAQKLAVDDPLGQAIVTEQRATHREKKRDMKHSVKYSMVVQHIAPEESPDPRASRERLLRELSEEMRCLPTLPASDANPDIPCDGYDEAVQLPPKHCAFKGCVRVFNQESELRKHLYESHYKNGSAVLKQLVDGTTRLDAPQYIVCSIVNEAIATKIRKGAPFACNSIDRRALASFTGTLTDATTESLVCVSCACVFPRVATQRRHRISWEPAFDGGRFLGSLSAEETKHIFGFQQYLSRYGSLKDGPNLEASPFKESLQSWFLKVPFETGDVRILCCPEDRKCEVCTLQTETLCNQCEVPVCKQCKQALQHDPPRHPEGALTNDMWTGFASKIIYDEKVTVVEMICASACIVSLICFSMEVERDSLLQGKAHMARHRVGARGNTTVFPLPLQELFSELSECKDAEKDRRPPTLPRLGPELANIVKVIIKGNAQSIKKCITQAVVRRDVVVRLIMHAKACGHRAYQFIDEATEVAIRARAESLPENDIPDELVHLFEKNDASLEKLQPQKAATPVQGRVPEHLAFDSVRPNAVTDEKSGEQGGDINSKGVSAIETLVSK